jgi:hypothetical protein
MVAVGALHGSSVWLAPIYFTNIIDPEANAFELRLPVKVAARDR